MSGRVQRLTDPAGPAVPFLFDDEPMTGCEGDTVLTAVLSQRRGLRPAEFGPGTRAGFCLMGACQDCWIWRDDGQRLRACTTLLSAGMRLCSTAPKRWPA
ncbi:(2Fe-2S)-binding protein [Microbulbifer sp. S227A]|uniref:(2Fe-2S)-binding protein n=1 Tax=Microbulbifer sp. S227A TaxID=3415131 RepID=UPI003C7C3EC9